MFSVAGNAMIQGVVMTAKANHLDWDQVVEVLYDIATLDGFEEATDTVVREMVYEAIQTQTA
jgi:PBP1b-binding outer membrane lipoprotein LpoB